jgi:hypothetical protein
MLVNPNGILGQVRQGDVLIELVSPNLSRPAVPASAAPVLAEGETHGHSHRVFARDGAIVGRLAPVEHFRDPNLEGQIGRTVYGGTLLLDAPGEVGHVNRDGSATGEHQTLPLESGTHHVILQREYNPEADRRAAD